MMGASNPHPHCQIWSNCDIPNIPADRAKHTSRAHKETGRCLLCDYYRIEKNAATRIVIENAHFLAIVPTGPLWPLNDGSPAARRIDGRINCRARRAERNPEALTTLTTIIPTSFSYSMGFHQPPTDGVGHPNGISTRIFSAASSLFNGRKFMVGSNCSDAAARHHSGNQRRAPSRSTRHSPPLADDRLGAAITVHSRIFRTSTGELENVPRGTPVRLRSPFVPSNHAMKTIAPLHSAAAVQPVVVGAHVRINQRPGGSSPILSLVTVNISFIGRWRWARKQSNDNVTVARAAGLSSLTIAQRSC